MPLTVRCECGYSFEAPDPAPGAPLRCPNCGRPQGGGSPPRRGWRWPLVLTSLALLLAGGTAVVLFALPRRPAEPGWDAIPNARGLSANALPIDDEAVTAEKVAVLIGVNGYRHMQPLQYAERDAEELAKVLRELGFRTTLLTTKEGGTDAALMPTAANIKHQVALLGRAGKPGGLVVLGFAGHGVQFKGEDDAHFCPLEADVNDPKTLVSLQGIHRYLASSPAAAKLMLVDACRNDPRRSAAARGVNARTAPPPPRGVAAFYACSEGQVAYEDDDLRHGLFFHAVLDGARGKASNSAGQVTIHSLAEFVQNRVSDRAMMALGRSQAPNLVANLAGPAPVLAARKAAVAKPPERPEKKPADPPKAADPKAYTATEFDAIRGRLRAGDLGKMLLKATHPTGPFRTASTPEVSLSASGQEITATVTAYWNGGVLGLAYETDFRVTITKEKITVQATRDTAIVRIAPDTLVVAATAVRGLIR